jgi:hypothetical protein
LVEENVHPIPKLKYKKCNVLPKVSTGKLFQWIIHYWYIAYQNRMSL